MKYVLVTTQYWGNTEMVEERYLADEVYTHKLSEATIWNSFDDAADYIEDLELDDCKIVLVREKDYFMAKLEGK